MDKKTVLFLVLGLVLIAAFGLFSRAEAQQSGLPDIRFEGQGPATFTVEPPRMLMERSRRDGLIQFVTLSGTSSVETDDDPMYTIDFMPPEPLLIYEGVRNFGQVEAGCLVNYVQIKDDMDPDINSWLINGKLIQEISLDWVSYGSFVVPEAGELTYNGIDSAALIVQLCVQVVQTETPTETSVVDTPTDTPTNTATATPVESITPDAQITNTPTNTDIPVLGVQPSKTPVPEATSTKVSTPAVIPSTGGGPGSRAIAFTGLALLAGLGLVSFGWWRLLRGNRNGG